MKVHVCCRLATKPNRPVGLAENRIKGDAEVAVAVTVCQPSRNKQTIFRCINVISQPQELRTDSLLGNFLSMEEDKICEDHCERVQDGLDAGDCPPHMAMLLTQALRVCTSSGQKGQIQHSLIAYANVFCSSETDVSKMDLVKHCIPVEPGTFPI